MEHTIPHELQMPEDVVFIDGIEWWHRHLGFELVSLGLKGDNPTLSDATISWVAHPALYDWPMSTYIKAMKSVEGIYGLEWMNSGIAQFQPYELEEIFRECHPHFFNVDDFHIRGQEKMSWIEMDVDSLDKDTILETLISGDYWLESKR